MAKKFFPIRAALIVAAIFVASGFLIGHPRHRSFETVPEMQAFIHEVVPVGTNATVASQKMVAQGFEPCEISQSETGGRPCIVFTGLDGPSFYPVKTQWTVALIVKDDKVGSVLIQKSRTGL